ncbi:MAG: molybdopterin cofactor-binding domain-containing protein [Saprospiraceae bacterium]
MEPMNFFVDITPEKIDLVGPIQTPEWTANRVAKLLERPVEQVSIEMTRMGGGFGRRLYGDFALEAAEISNKISKPVKLVFSREDDMMAGTYRPAIKYKIKAGLKDDKVNSFEIMEAAANSTCYDLIPTFFPAAAAPNYKFSSAKFDSPITTGAWRAPYTNFLGYAVSAFCDELAEELNMDPVELQLQLLESSKQHMDESMEWNPQRMIDTIKLLAEKGNWGKAPEGTYQGFSAYYSHNTHVAEIVEVEMKDGKPVVKKVVAAVDCGIVVNPTGAINQVQGGAIDGIGHAMYGNFSFVNGEPQANNFNKYRLIRMMETPKVEVHFVESSESPTGLGEPGLPPAGGALANAIYKATGKRIYHQPFADHI